MIFLVKNSSTPSSTLPIPSAASFSFSFSTFDTGSCNKKHNKVNTHSHTHLAFAYMYVYICVCVCLSAFNSIKIYKIQYVSLLYRLTDAKTFYSEMWDRFLKCFIKLSLDNVPSNVKAEWQIWVCLMLWHLRSSVRLVCVRYATAFSLATLKKNRSFLLHFNIHTAGKVYSWFKLGTHFRIIKT